MTGSEPARPTAIGYPPPPVGVESAAQHRFNPRRGLTWLGAYGAGGLALSVIYASTGLGVPDPLRALTGWWCPLCGGTRMGAELLHGHLGAAFLFNPLAFIGLVVAIALGLIWSIESLGGPALRPPGALRRISAKQLWIGVGVISVVFMIARNLLR